MLKFLNLFFVEKCYLRLYLFCLSFSTLQVSHFNNFYYFRKINNLLIGIPFNLRIVNGTDARPGEFPFVVSELK